MDLEGIRAKFVGPGDRPTPLGWFWISVVGVIFWGALLLSGALKDDGPAPVGNVLTASAKPAGAKADASAARPQTGPNETADDPEATPKVDMNAPVAPGSTETQAQIQQNIEIGMAYLSANETCIDSTLSRLPMSMSRNEMIETTFNACIVYARKSEIGFQGVQHLSPEELEHQTITARVREKFG